MNLHATQPHESQLDEGPTALASPPSPGGRFTYATGARPLAGYTIKRGIGHGGFGEVYYATSDAGKEVALKLIRRNWDVELRGVMQCLNLKHPNLLSLYDVRQDTQGDNWVVMELMSGESLEDVVARHPNGLPEPEALLWMHGIAAGVAYLHDHGIVHRDLKPGNIFIDEGFVKIGDYGLSKFISCSRRSGQTGSVGTVHYMAPEIANGRYGKEIDIYALGIILYEMLTGHVPFEGESVGEILMKHLTAEPDTNCVAEPYRTIVARCLAKDPAKRFSSVGELISLLPLAQGAVPSTATRYAPNSTPPAHPGTGFADPTSFSLASEVFAVPAAGAQSKQNDPAPRREGVTPPPLPASARAAADRAPSPPVSDTDPILSWVRDAWSDLSAWWVKRNFRPWQKLLILAIGLFLAFNLFRAAGGAPPEHAGGQGFFSFLFVVAIFYLIVRRIQRKKASRSSGDYSSQGATSNGQKPVAANDPAAMRDPIAAAPAMRQPPPVETTAAATGYSHYYQPRLNPLGRIVFFWAAIGAAVAFLIVLGDAGGDIDRAMKKGGLVPTVLAGIVAGTAALLIVQISRLVRRRSAFYAPIPSENVATPPPLPPRESPTRRRWKFASSNLIYRPGPPRERITQLFGSLLLSAATCLVVALVVMFLRGETPEPNQYAWLAMSSIIGSWCVLVPAKIWEGSRGDAALRRFVMLAIGLAFGAIAFGLLNWLMISLSAYAASPMGGPARGFRNGFFDGNGDPKMIAFLAYFGFLFLIVRWWRLADPVRSTRLSIWHTVVAVFCSWILTIFWPFPQPWGVMVAATIAISVQLASPWLSPTERAALARPSAGG
jgi:serine/threonine protein kinase